MLKKVSILGSGSWGTALAMLLSANADKVRLWSRSDKQVQEINHKHVNRNYLPREEIPANVVATTDLAEMGECEVLIFCVPSKATRAVAADAAERIALPPNAPVVCATKGVEKDTGKRITEIVAEYFPDHPIAVISGPNHAEEVARHMATATVIGCRDEEAAAKLQQWFTLPWFRTYTSDDVAGIEIGGAAKNVFAIAGGIAEGLGLGDNAKAALVTRGLAELSRLGIQLGGRAETFQGLSGMGDLVVTCYSSHSRNNLVGQMLGKGHTVEEITDSLNMVAEGIPNTESLYEAARRAGIRTPIIDQVYAIIYEDKAPADALSELLNRDPRPEAE
ncbi:MAG: NAD(P)H-dependent glycerol-3-phosphate dehydrogenase [Verrucomicrobiota bacterium]